ncbi:hypothetical protein AYI70_g5126 [Smittium culicis]|uniref:Uncharacterized protein n=1 Tax=Smittium culicis TaxID=133412 RepID=A0A1R1XVY5_9FUNG|nr:hypothetical protein AYI70_g5126 [Smittium culicis]
MELNLASGSKRQTETTDSNSDRSSMKISILVPRPDEIINCPTASAASEKNNSRPQKRKIAINREQALDSDSLAGQRRVLLQQSFSDFVVGIFF